MSTSSDPNPQTGAPDDPVPKEGDVLAGKYRIEKVLGQGGMGVVVAAQHTALRQKVAVKFLLPEAAKRDDATERFLREARAAVSIQSEHVARVMDVGTLDSGSPYMVMEYLTGSDLGAVLLERGKLPLEEAVDYILQACEAIAEAHAIGIIHRDLKPANLFLTQRAGGSPLVKVLDFGLSKVTKPDSLDASLTAANVVMGSPCYMSPEQIRSLKNLDARTDIWALGVILYQILTGVRPFEAPSLGALFFTIGADPPMPPRARRPDIPPGLEAAVLKCLEKDPSARTQSIAELARSIAPFGSEGSRTSVEQIHRVLSDATPFPMRRHSVGDGTPGAASLEAARAEAFGDNDPTIAAPGSSGPQPAPAFGAHPSAPPPNPWQPQAPAIAPAVGGAASFPSSPPGGPPGAPPSVMGNAKSGSMAAVAKDGLGLAPSIPPPPRAPRRTGRIVAGVVGLAVAAVVGVTAFSLRGPTSQGLPAATGALAEQAATSPVPAAPPPTATANVAATAEPTASAAAATATAAAATATADAAATGAAASASAAATKPLAPKVLKPAGATKKPRDVMEKRK